MEEDIVSSEIISECADEEKGLTEELEIEETGNDDSFPKDVSAKEETEQDGPRDSATDYSLLAEKDLEELKAEFPALRGLESLTQLENPLRYGALRDLGLSPKEAYLATTERFLPKYDNKGHLSSAVPKMAARQSSDMSTSQLEAARMLFLGLSDREIQRLYKKVTQN